MRVEVPRRHRASADPLELPRRQDRPEPMPEADATNRWNAGASAGGTSGSARRRNTSTPASTAGGGTKAPRGRRLEILASYQALQSTPLTLLGHGTPSLCATAHSTIRSARASGVRDRRADGGGGPSSERRGGSRRPRTAHQAARRAPHRPRRPRRCASAAGELAPVSGRARPRGRDPRHRRAQL